MTRPRGHGLRASLGALTVLSVLWLGSAAAIRLVHRDKVLHGTTMAGVAFGGADATKVRRALERVDAGDRAVVLAFGERRFTVTAAAVGMRVHLGRSVSRALEAGRGGLLDFVTTPAAALGLRRVLQPEYAISQPAIAGATAGIAQQVDRRPFDGGLSIDPSTFAVGIEPPRDGRLVDRFATARTIAAGLRDGLQRSLALPVRTRRAPPVREVRRVAGEARSYLANGSMRLTGAGPTITLSPRRVARLLAVERRPSRNGARLGLGVDDGDVARLVAGLSTRRDRSPIDARINVAAPALVLDVKGSASWRPRRVAVGVRRARAGRAIQREGAASAIAAAIGLGRHEVGLPVRSLPPAMSTSAARRVRSVLGTFTTRFPCCRPRVTNIRLIARLVDDTVVAPGEQFSLNEVAGERTRRRGFVPAPFIADGKIVPSVGGGVSQFSTTMYNAAYFAGLKIDAHQPHSFYIDRYPAGREATLDYRSIDLSWTNDTRAPVLVRASSTPTSVTVTLYGANGGRRVRAAAGPRKKIRGRDFSITVTRTIRYAGGRVVRQSYVTTYDKPPEDE